MNKIRVYISHPIMGSKKEKATKEDMVENNNKAIIFGSLLQCKFPNVDFYIPAVGDEFVMMAYETGLLTIEQILEIDCKLLSKRNILLNYIPDQYISDGMLKENMCAQECGIPILMAKDIDAAEKVLNRALESIRRNGKWRW